MLGNKGREGGIYIKMREGYKEKDGRPLGNPSNNKAFHLASMPYNLEIESSLCRFHLGRDLPICDQPPASPLFSPFPIRIYAVTSRETVRHYEIHHTISRGSRARRRIGPKETLMGK